ncbi:hypothetical protein YA0089_28085 [Pseudomonas viridiflava]|uniref:hypothetical protein n=1 Tax=Pseudomonas viridiflava TaxID=33069 RepID=UPI0018E6238D|nr:hypothetical protein [Pseudomonas viridiflava]MBI6727482.1 hypothetical protein [Pseudomonas viridiflava]
MDIQMNKFADTLDTALGKAVAFMDRNKGDLILASFPISIIGHMATLTAQNMSHLPGGSSLVGNMVLAAGLALTAAIPLVLGASLTSGAAKMLLPEKAPDIDVAAPLKYWNGKPASVGYSKNMFGDELEFGINIPGHGTPHKGAKEIDAFSLPELTEIVSSFKNTISPLQNDKLRDLIGKTRHAGYVDDVALPAITAEMAASAKKIFETSGLSPQTVYDLTAVEYLKALEKNEGREVPNLAASEPQRQSRTSESLQVSM